MSYHFIHGSEVTFVDDSLPKSTTTFSYDSDYNSNEDDDIKFAETTSLDSEERASIRKRYLSNKAARVQFPSTLLQKENLTLPRHAITLLHLLAEFNRIFPHPGTISRLSPPSRTEFISNLTSLPILPPLEYFAQYSTDDLSCLYQSLIDSFQRELLKFNLSPRNEVHIEWM